MDLSGTLILHVTKIVLLTSIYENKLNFVGYTHHYMIMYWDIYKYNFCGKFSLVPPFFFPLLCYEVLVSLFSLGGSFES